MANETQQNQKRENFAATVTGCALYTSQTGTDAVAIQVKATENLSTGEKVERLFTGYLYLTARAIDNAIKTLHEAFNYTQNSFVPLNNNALAGKECEITVQYDEYNGEMRPKIQFFNAPGSFMGRKLKPLEKEKAEAIAARFDCYFAGGSAAVAANSYAPGARHAEPASNAAEDDLPF